MHYTMILTAAIETIIISTAMHRIRRDTDIKLLLTAVISINFVTNFLLNIAMIYLIKWHLVLKYVYAASLEFTVFLTEAIFYRIVLKLKNRTCLLISLISNAASFGFGYMLTGP